MGEMVTIPTDNSGLSAYLATPTSGKGPAILLLHAWWGLTDFFTTLADRLAGEGFVVLGTDLYGGKTADKIEDAERLINMLKPYESVQQLNGAVDYLLEQPSVEGDHVGVVGFSMGAAYGTWLSTLRPEISSVVVFYGGIEQEENFASLTSADFLGHFAENDDYESSELIQPLEEQLRAAGKEAYFYIYPGTGHWFFEDNRPDVYDPEAARLAWERTVQFLHDKLD